MSKAIDEFIEKKKALQKEMEKKGMELMKELFEDFWKANPECKLLIWTQYAPHFNDGDACIFSVYDFYAWKKTKAELDEQGISDWEDVPEGEDDNYIYEPTGAAEKAYRALTSKVVDLEDLFQQTFGDGYKVFASPEGFETEEYSHD
jgi:hypothetical protein